ncbi:MAG TPA: ABC transporter permease [Chitinophaga sp.]|uniref:ABC transporter permease n=1 Tax=Chitinophaga sp. TaxID=1869181 RepID=UPI002DB9FFE3|nr:ABC transporter permease [Chitinophaga sp.]HEU4552143.1 ABC transporter permease [Chitinophaga sp.]
MLKNYFKIAWRNVRKNKLYAILNITGLAAGMAIAMLIGLWVADEWQFNKQFDNYRRIGWVYQHIQNNGETGTGLNMPFPVTATLRKDFSSYIKYAVVCTWDQTHVLSQGERRLTATGIYSEPDLPRMLTLKMRAGGSRLTEPNTILLSESQAKACFGNEDPLNKTLMVDNKTAVVVAGVYKDMPANSSFSSVGFILPWALYARQQELDKNDNPWRSNSYRALVQIAEHTTMQQVSALIKDVKLKNIHKDELSFHPQLFLFPMSRWHLYAEFKNGVNVGGFIKYVWLFSISGVFILLLACINFMNLSTARSGKRAREVGIRKVIGSQRSQLMCQFFSESLLSLWQLLSKDFIILVVIALAIACPVAYYAMAIWLQHYAYHTAVPWWVFPAAGIGTLCITLLTVSWQAVKAAVMNPVKSLRSE